MVRKKLMSTKSTTLNRLFLRCSFYVRLSLTTVVFLITCNVPLTDLVCLTYLLQTMEKIDLEEVDKKFKLIKAVVISR